MISRTTQRPIDVALCCLINIVEVFDPAYSTDDEIDDDLADNKADDRECDLLTIRDEKLRKTCFKKMIHFDTCLRSGDSNSLITKRPRGYITLSCVPLKN